MKILLCEDECYKRDMLKAFLENMYEDVKIFECETFNSFLSNFHRDDFDVIIFDFMLPRVLGGSPENIVQDFLESVKDNVELQNKTIICTTAFSDIFEEMKEEFVSLGVWVIYFDEEDAWKGTISNILSRMIKKYSADVLFICAIEEEIKPFRSAVGFKHIDERNFPFSAFEFEDFCGVSGVCVLQSSMGLTDSAVTTTCAVSFFRPKVIVMVGVCAGIKDEVNMGQAIFADPAWEFMSGKWMDHGLKSDPDQRPLDHSTRLKIEKFLENWDKIKTSVSKDFFGSSPGLHKPIIGPMASGPAVIASPNVIRFIEDGKRKVAGVEMEAAGFYRSLRLISERVPYFAVKSVMDFADNEKNDKYKEFAAFSSARIGAYCAKIFIE